MLLAVRLETITLFNLNSAGIKYDFFMEDHVTHLNPKFEE